MRTRAFHRPIRANRPNRPNRPFFPLRALAPSVAAALLLFAATVSASEAYYHLTARNTLTAEGEIPAGSTASVRETATTGKIGQMTAGNSVTFVIRQLPPIIITSLSVQVHSNKSAGAGRLEVYRNEKLTAETGDAPFSDPSWNGAFSSEFVNIGIDIPDRLLTTSGDSLVVRITATENSLFAGGLEMSWEAGAEERHSVGFMTGVAEIHIGAIRESAPNTGITLPRIESEYGGYRLAGWQRERSSQITERPDYLLPGSTFYPDRDMTLYAIWRSAETEKWHQSTERKTGIYIIGDTWKHCVMRGNVGGDGKIMPAEMPEWETDAEGRRCLSADAETDGEMLYEIRFETGQTARIRHKNTGESVGYSSSSSISLTKTDVSWSWTEIEDGQIRFYHQYESGDVRYLWANEGETLQTIDELRFAAQNFCYTGYGILLFDTADQPAAAVYTYFPLETGVEETRAGVSDVKERRVYSLTGQEMRGKVGRGIWIVVEGDKQQGSVKRLLVNGY